MNTPEAEEPTLSVEDTVLYRARRSSDDAGSSLQIGGVIRIIDRKRCLNAESAEGSQR